MDRKQGEKRPEKEEVLPEGKPNLSSADLLEDVWILLFSEQFANVRGDQAGQRVDVISLF